MDNLWPVLAQTLALSVAAAVLLAAKRLFLDKLSPRWQYGVWAILALRALLPAGLLGRTLVPGGRAVLEAARLQVGDTLSLEGRVQSRTYRKVLEDGTAQERVAYEVSAMHLLEPEAAE